MDHINVGVFKRRTTYQPTDTSKPVDANFHHLHKSLGVLASSNDTGEK